MKTLALIPLVVLALASTGCASPGLERARALPVDSKLQPLPQGTAYQYIDPRRDFSIYRRLMLEPVAVYAGTDHGFGDVLPADRAALAKAIGPHAARILGGGKVTLADAPGPDVLRLRLTVVGITRSRALLQGVTYVIPIGAALNLAKGASGGGGTFTGSVVLAGEFHDSVSGELVAQCRSARGRVHRRRAGRGVAAGGTARTLRCARAAVALSSFSQDGSTLCPTPRAGSRPAREDARLSPSPPAHKPRA
jgi:hypothetical protein